MIKAAMPHASARGQRFTEIIYVSGFFRAG
jgi:hypothetical protein